MSPARTRHPILPVLILCLTAAPLLAGDPPPSASKLQREMNTAYRAGNYEQALKAAEQLHKLRPDHTETIYNIACLHCLLGQKAKAYDWLKKAIDAGFSDAGMMAADPDLRTIQGEDKFRALLHELRSAKAATRAASEGGAARGSASGHGTSTTAQPKDEDEEEEEELSPREKQAKVNELTQKLIEAAGDEEYDKALEYARQANKVMDNGLTNYNLACMYSLLKKKEEAFKYLRTAIDKGDFPQDLVAQMESDKDLDFIRGEAEFKELLALAGKEEKPARRGGRAGAAESKAKFEWKVTQPGGKKPSKASPLLVVLHPSGGDMVSTTAKWKKAAAKAGAVLLTPQGTTRMGEGKYDWGRDLDEIESNVNEAIDKVMDAQKIDKARVIIAGFSQGGWAAWHLALRSPDAFCGVIPICGKCDDLPASAFEDDEDAKQLRVFVMIGAEEDEKLLKANKSCAKKLEKAGLKVKLSSYEGVGHDYPEQADEELAKALKFILN